MVKDLKEWDDRVRKAMIPPVPEATNNFSPGIQGIRKTAGKRRPPSRGAQLPTIRR